MNRKFLLSLLVIAGLIAMESCETGKLEFDIISTPPTVRITAPASVLAGSSTALTATAADGEISPLVEGTITLRSGTTVISTNTQRATGLTLNLSIPATVVAALNPGTYILEVVAKDNADQSSSASANVAITCEAIAACRQEGRTTVIVITPGVTPPTARIGLIGSLTGWSTDILMTRIANNCYCAAVEFPANSEFKFRRSRDGASNPDWTFVEKGPACEETDNRRQNPAPNQTITFTVSNWRNTGACPD